MRTQISTVWMENEQVADRKMAYEMGYSEEVYRARITEEERIERELNNLSIRLTPRRSSFDIGRSEWFKKRDEERTLINRRMI